MKKICLILAVFTVLFFAVSCDSGLKFENPLDPNNRTADSEETGTLGGKCYPNKTCDNGLVCDKENNVCIKNPGNADNNPATCGNRVLDKGEVCDGGTKECSEINAGYIGGYATCKTNCKGWDTTECQRTSVNPDPADGDSIYALSVGNVSADTDLVGIIAAEVVSEAIKKAVFSATDAYGFISAHKITK